MTFVNVDDRLIERVDREIRERRVTGLDGLVGGLECIIINTEIDHHIEAAQEILNYTGFTVKETFKDNHFKTIVLTCEGSADILIRSRLGDVDPFMKFNKYSGSYKKPHTRLETFVFETNDIYHYLDVQKKRGLKFSKTKIEDYDQYYYVESIPSDYTGVSYGIIQWKTELKSYRHKKAKDLNLKLDKPKDVYLKDICELDHVAVRIRPEDRDDAIMEFMNYTNYVFAFAIYVEALNSITSVTRISNDKFALVFTAGIEDGEVGPTQKFIENYGIRPHHMAFRTERIEEVVGSLKNHGMSFLLELVGDREQGLKQIFTTMSDHTLLVNEYIQRYDGFDGYFTKNNVKLLTKATEKQ